MIFANGTESIDEKPRDVEHLRQIISRFSLCAKVDNDGVVAVDSMMGNALYFAKSPTELAWLRENSHEVEPRGLVTKYHIRFQKD